MSDLRTAAQQALEALEHHGRCLPWNAFVEVRKDLRAALAQQAEPVSADPHTTTLRALLECCLSWEPDACVLGNVTARQAITALRAALAQKDEPAQAISECIAVLRPMVKGKFPHEQALDELVGYTASPQRTMVPLTEKEMYAVDEEARKNFRLSQKGPRGQQITYWDGLTPWLIRAVERAHGIKE